MQQSRDGLAAVSLVSFAILRYLFDNLAGSEAKFALQK